MRIVTLLPSATEIVYALGLEPVAVSHECDYPPEAAGKPAVNGTRIDPTATSAEIDGQVLDAEREGEGVYEIDLDALAEADPDLIVTQGLCDVCAVDEVLVERAVERLDLDCRILTTDPHSLADVFDDVRRVGRATGREGQAEQLVAELRAGVNAVRDVAATVEDRPRVAVLDWLDPVMTAGHWVPEMIEYAGGEALFDAPASVPREWEEIREADPDVLVAAPCGFGLDQTAANLTDLTERPGWDDLTAVRSGRAYAMDGHHYVNRPGPRLLDTLEYLAVLLHPALFDAPPEDAARPLSHVAV
ncbi:cobalamin-binding protein [Halomarina halobia]|uniref:Cobalamin-binding protein n=1 Tax=Halomarina halobia TaxID=3033386 RepID=A0ABD6AAM9_9EURY|nr:cobalamin-binding protein [Halomarina sp. PSR21]